MPTVKPFGGYAWFSPHRVFQPPLYCVFVCLSRSTLCSACWGPMLWTVSTMLPDLLAPVGRKRKRREVGVFTPPATSLLRETSQSLLSTTKGHPSVSSILLTALSLFWELPLPFVTSALRYIKVSSVAFLGHFDISYWFLLTPSLPRKYSLH